MQELLGRIARLDPSASLGLRVIACFDELVVGNVNTKALLSAAASLSACPAGFHQSSPSRTMLVGPRGDVLPVPCDAPWSDRPSNAVDGLTVWLDRDGASLPNDAIILERLALAVRIRHGRGRDGPDTRRDLGRLVAEDSTTEERQAAAASLGLQAGRRYRVVAAPLFAVWERHPSGPEDVVSTLHGPIHAIVVPAETETSLRASPVGVGVARPVEQLPHSFRTAMVALRLCDPPAVGVVSADEYGGLVDLIADAPTLDGQGDADALDGLDHHAWGRTTVDALIRSQSVRQAARLAGVHHSTMHARVGTLTDLLGFDPFDGFGTTRLGVAYLVWRLRRSRVLDLPAPPRP